MTLKEKLEEELKILDEIQETKNLIRQTKSAMIKEQLLKHLHKLENKWRALYV